MRSFPIGMSGARTRRGRAFVAGAGIVAIAVAGILAVVSMRRAEPPDAVFRRALVALESGDLDVVAAAITALEQNPGYDDHALLLRGGRSLRLRDYDVALRHLSRLPAEGELREPTLLLTGECLYLVNRLSEAEGVFRLAAAEFPENAEVHRWLGAIYYDLGAMEHAIGALNRLARLKPLEYQPYRLLGHIYADYERYQEAITAYQEALNRNPPQPIRNEIVEGLGNCLVQEHRYSEALSVLEPLPDEPSALALRAESLWSLGRREEAREVVDRARRLFPNDGSVALLSARMARESGRGEDALPILLQLVGNEPRNAEGRYQLALVYRDLGRPADYEREIAEYQKSLDLRLRLSELNTRAIAEPNNAELRDEIAELCDRLGKRELAAVWRRAADAVRQSAAGQGFQAATPAR